MPMNKRHFLGTLGAGSAALAAMRSGWPVSRARAAETLTGVTYLTPAYKGLMWGMTGFVDRLKETGGDALAARFAAISLALGLIGLIAAEFLARRVQRLLGR